MFFFFMCVVYDIFILSSIFFAFLFLLQHPQSDLEFDGLRRAAYKQVLKEVSLFFLVFR
jgi:hypothetical protein